MWPAFFGVGGKVLLSSDAAVFGCAEVETFAAGGAAWVCFMGLDVAGGLLGLLGG